MDLLRRDSPFFAVRWWHGVDKPLLWIALLLLAFGLLAVTSTGPASALRVGFANPNHFVIRQYIFAGMSLVAIVFFSMLPARRVSELMTLLGCGCVLAMLWILLFGEAINQSKRWLDLGLFSIQPSEFLKPAFIVILCRLFATSLRKADFPGPLLGFCLYLVLACMLLMQPDFGQWALISAGFLIVAFLTGQFWVWFCIMLALGVAVALYGYHYAPHTVERVRLFLDPEKGDGYQIMTALRAVKHGGLTGRGAGEGSVKYALPDSHTDFIFAVIVEEYGVLFAALLVAFMVAVVVRGSVLASQQLSFFKRSAIASLSILLALQGFVNMAVNLSLLPTKGLTLPFISYGGSSLLASGLTVGVILSLARPEDAPSLRRKPKADV